MKPAIQYNIEWVTTKTQKTVQITIADQVNLIQDFEVTEEIDLKPAGNPLTISVIDNDQDKFTPIRSKQAVIRFIADSPQGKNLNTFLDSSDNQWKVTISVNASIMFVGFLMLSDMQAPFQPDPQVVELTASDHLGLLRDIPLTDFDGLTPQNENRIADYLTWALSKTGLSLILFVINNIRERNSSAPMIYTFSGNTISFVTADLASNGIDPAFFYVNQVISIDSVNRGFRTITAINVVGANTNLTVNGAALDPFTNIAATLGDFKYHLYDKVYLNAKTFEEEIGTCENCYSVIEKILGEDCFLTQFRGGWYIVRVDEINNLPLYRASFGTDGDIIEVTETSFNKDIGVNEDHLFAEADCLLQSDRPHRFIKETFRYEKWKEIICNIDFSRGEENYILPGPDELSYDAECWSNYSTTGLSPRFTLSNNPPTSDAYIKKIFTNGYEDERYAVIPVATSSPNWLSSYPLEVGLKDKINISIDYRWSEDRTSGGSITVTVAVIGLAGDNGTNWFLDEDGKWYLSDANWATNIKALQATWVPNDVDETDWRTVSVDSQPAPVEGQLYIGLRSIGTIGGSVDDADVYFQNISIDYLPFINGSYQPYTGQYNQVDKVTTETLRTKRDKQIFMSDSPNENLKGSLLKISQPDGDVFRLTESFYHGQDNELIAPANDVLFKRWDYWQAYAVWNQYIRGVRIFTGSVYGLTDLWPDLVYNYTLTDTNDNTNNRNFLLISFSQDWKSELWTAVFIECFRTDIGRSYNDTLTFKYITGE